MVSTRHQPQDSLTPRPVLNIIEFWAIQCILLIKVMNGDEFRVTSWDLVILDHVSTLLEAVGLDGDEASCSTPSWDL